MLPVFLKNEGAIRLLKLITVDDKCHGPRRIQVLELGDLHLPAFVILIFARLLRLVGQLPARGHEIDAIYVLCKINDVTTRLAETTIPDLFLDIDGETIVALPAFWTGAY